LGIVLAFVILALWREILALGAILVVLAIVLIVVGVAVAGIYWFATDHQSPVKGYDVSRSAIDAWAAQNETTLIILALTYVALVAVYVIGQIRKDRAAAKTLSAAAIPPSPGNQQSNPQVSDQFNRQNIRAALDAAVSDEKARIKKILDESEVKFARSTKAMEPVIAALESLKLEVGEVEGLEITTSHHGYSATVRLKSSWSERSFEISPSSDNRQFDIKEYDSSHEPDYQEKYHSCATRDDVLKIAIDAIGKHIASKQIATERKK
jgi:hypothetical protein